MTLKNKIVLTTFSLFMIEAIFHYNQGKKDTEQDKQTKGFLPPTKSLVRLGIIVGVFSILNGVIVEEIK
tara:strand:+ start:2172 stop:2378 length:207 start_codon:yes stop_codon:yes gene_type:complete